MIARCLLAILLVQNASTRDFVGVSRLARFSHDANATLLVYFNNENNFAVLDHGRAVPMRLDTHLWVPEICCAHRATPSLSRDGRRIAFVHLKSAHPRREAIGIFDLSTGTQKDVFLTATVWGISWSPRSDRLAFVADQDGDKGHKVQVMDVTSGELRVSAAGMEIRGERYMVSDYAPPSWNPDGTKLAVELRRSGPGANNSAAGVIAIWDLYEREMRKLADGVEPSWSPASDVIAFFDSSRRHCYSISSEGFDRTQLFAATKGLLGTGGRAPFFYPLVWSPDGRRLIFHEWVDADLIAEIYQFDLVARKTRHVGRSELQVVNWR